MPERLITVDDTRNLNNADNIASLFQQLAYKAELSLIDIEDLQLTPQSTAAIYDVHLIADQGEGGLQVLLFQLQPDEWDSPSRASSRMKAISSQIGRRSSEFLLLATATP
jgi:adenine-specific DNA-methyltransferase